jgi:DNA-binding MarR family transcriptional regulator
VDSSVDAAALRSLIQRFVRSFGLLASDRTPCGKPLAASHAHALMALAERSREHRLVTQQELGRLLGIDKSNVARLCSKMERAGHIKQERSPDDGRARLISLTKAGVRVAETVGQASQERFRRVLDAVQPEHRVYLLSALERLNGAVSSITELELEAHLPGPAAPRAIHRPARRTSPRSRMRNQETS